MSSTNTNLAGAEGPGGASDSLIPDTSSAASANTNTNALASPDLSPILAALAAMQSGIEATASATQAGLAELSDRVAVIELNSFQDTISSPARVPPSRPSLAELQPERRASMYTEPGAGLPSTPEIARSMERGGVRATDQYASGPSSGDDALRQVQELARQAEELKQKLEQQQLSSAFNAQGVLTTASKKDFKGRLTSLDFPSVVEFLRLFRLHVLEEGNIFSLILYITTECRREIISQFNAHSGSTTKLTETSLLGDTASPAMTPSQRQVENERIRDVISKSFSPRTYVDVFLRARQCFAVGEVHGIDLLSGESPDFHAMQLYCSALCHYISDVLDTISFAFSSYSAEQRTQRSHIMPRYRFSKQYDISDASRKFDLESIVIHCLFRPAKNGYDLVIRQLYLTSCADHKSVLDEDKHAAQGGSLSTLTLMLSTISTKAERLQAIALSRVHEDETLGVMRQTLTRTDLYEQLTGKKATDYFKTHLATKPRQPGAKRDDNDAPAPAPRKPFVPFGRKTSFSALGEGKEVEEVADSFEVHEASPSLRHDVDENDDYRSVDSDHDDEPYESFELAKAQDESRPLDLTEQSLAALVGGNPSHPLRAKTPLTKEQMRERPCFSFQKPEGCPEGDKCQWSHDPALHIRALQAELNDRQNRIKVVQSRATGHQQRAAQHQPPRQELRRSERGHDRR